jgi:hypothetical protein
MSTENSIVKNPRRGPRIAHYYIAIAVDIVLLYVLNNLRYMGISLITDYFTSCLWAINLSLSFGIVGNFTLLLYRPRWFHHLVQAILSLLAIIAVYVVYSIFPFNLGGELLPRALRIILILIMAGAAIGLLVEVVKFTLAWMQREKPPAPPSSAITPGTPESPPSLPQTESLSSPPTAEPPAPPAPPAVP